MVVAKLRAESTTLDDSTFNRALAKRKKNNKNDESQVGHFVQLVLLVLLASLLSRHSGSYSTLVVEGCCRRV